MRSIFATQGLQRVLDSLPHARLVGGAVRDTLARRPVTDIDLATPDRPDEVMQALKQARIASIPTGLAHGTITAVSKGRHFEITTLRRDTATDGRHASVAWTDDWREDAARRDFTINAMFMDREGQVFDYFNGRGDLTQGRVRFVGDPTARIAEDYLRILRFFRFWARYGRGEADAEAMQAIAAGVSGLAILSAERVWSEIKRILSAPDPTKAFWLMQLLGVLKAVLPEGADPARLATLVAGGAPADPLLRFAALAPGDLPAMTARLKMSNAETERLESMRVALPLMPDADDDAVRRQLALYPAPVLIERSWLAGGFGADWDRLRARLETMERPVFPLLGRDARALGAPAGAVIGAALRETEAWWLAGGCRADTEACRQVLAAALRRLTVAAGPAS